MIRCIIHDASMPGWLSFENPVEILQVSERHDVLSSLRYVEEQGRRKGLHAAGFISYEASPAFDTALRTREPSSFPLLWFALFKNVSRTALGTLPEGPVPSAWSTTITPGDYHAAIAKIKEHIAAGNSYQVNFSFRMRTEYSGRPSTFFRRIQQAQHASFAAFIETDAFAICSASPELFFSLESDTIVARPMKGTMPRGMTLDSDRRMAGALHSSEKNRAENLMIVDMMRNDIGRIAEVGSVHVAELYKVEKYPTVWQMTSTVRARTNASITDILIALFPCASVTGAPKARTMEIIQELESTPRNIYTGTVGFLMPQRKAQFNVAIRTVLIDKERGEAEYGTGGGVTWASTSEGEYEECFVKARVLAEERPEFDLLETLRFSKREGFFLLDEHLSRLKGSAEYFGFPFEEAGLRRKITELSERLQKRADEGHRVRLLLHKTGTMNVEVHRQEPIPEVPVRLKFARRPVATGLPFLYHKSTHRQVYDEALASATDCDDVIVWNERNEITETTTANIVVEMEGGLYTPPVECGLLAGTFRSLLLKEGKIRERVLTVEETRDASRVFVINSVRGWREAIIVAS